MTSTSAPAGMFATNALKKSVGPGYMDTLGLDQSYEYSTEERDLIATISERSALIQAKVKLDQLQAIREDFESISQLLEEKILAAVTFSGSNPQRDTGAASAPSPIKRIPVSAIERRMVGLEEFRGLEESRRNIGATPVATPLRSVYIDASALAHIIGGGNDVYLPRLGILDTSNYLSSILQAAQFKGLSSPLLPVAHTTEASSAHISTEASSAHLLNSWSERSARIIDQLRLLPERWTDNELVLPSEGVIRAVELVSSYLPETTHTPEVDVDDSAGIITLAWWSDDNSTSFSLVFPNEKVVLGVVTQKEGFKPQAWRFSINDEINILKEIERHEFVQGLVFEK